MGGTGPQGKGLGYRFARHGHSVVVGSRAAEKAEVVAEEIRARLDGVDGAGEVSGAANADACAEADIVVLAVPWDGHDDLVGSLPLAGKTVVSCVNPLAFDKRGAHGLVIDAGEGSAAERAQALAPEATVVGAFHNVSAVVLLDESVASVDCDVLVLGEVREATDTVIALASRIAGVRGIFGGRLRNAAQIESLTANIIAINRRYKTHASISITGL